MVGREKIEAAKFLEREQPLQVIDSHVHFAKDWQDGEIGLPNGWLRSEGESFRRNWTEHGPKSLRTEIAAAGGAAGFQVEGIVFVECANGKPEEEVAWVLGMVEDPQSLVQALVCNVDVAQGGDAVTAFLQKLTEQCGGSLPSSLKGARQVLLGNPMPPADACLQPAYLDGLKALHAAGLHWEWACLPEAIPSITKVCASLPEMTFVLNHLGHNNGGDDFETWAPAITELAKNCPNVVAKLGAIEEWRVSDPAPFLDHALGAFGLQRVMYESNWFVPAAFGGKAEKYDKTFGLVKGALTRAGASADEVKAVFNANAKRVYRL
jgi:L-fuconolactonase